MHGTKPFKLKLQLNRPNLSGFRPKTDIETSYFRFDMIHKLDFLSYYVALQNRRFTLHYIATAEQLKPITRIPRIGIILLLRN